jgi:acetyl esterase/lipase
MDDSAPAAAAAGDGNGEEDTTMASKESRRVNHYWETVLRSTMNPQPDDLVTNAQWDLLTGEPGGVDYLEADAGGVPALWAVPHGTASNGPVLLCFHGGGYVGGSMFTHRKMFAHLAKAIGVRALVIGYTLLPHGGIYPRPVVEGLTAYRWLLDQGIPAGRIAFAGDSAGGHLSMTVQLRARTEGLPLPAATMLISPWTDLEVTGESMDYNDANDALFTKQWITDLAAGFLNGHDPRDPAAGPRRCTPISAASVLSTSRWAIRSCCSTTAACSPSTPSRPESTSSSTSSPTSSTPSRWPLGSPPRQTMRSTASPPGHVPN